MPDRNPFSQDCQSVFALCLLDLRTQYEAQLRFLSKAQRALEEYRGSGAPEERAQTLAVIREQMQRMRAATSPVAAALAEAEREAALLESEPSSV